MRGQHGYHQSDYIAPCDKHTHMQTNKHIFGGTSQQESCFCSFFYNLKLLSVLTYLTFSKAWPTSTAKANSPASYNQTFGNLMFFSHHFFHKSWHNTQTVHIHVSAHISRGQTYTTFPQKLLISGKAQKSPLKSHLDSDALSLTMIKLQTYLNSTCFRQMRQQFIAPHASMKYFLTDENSVR